MDRIAETTAARPMTNVGAPGDVGNGTSREARALLACGVAAGPLFVLVALAQAVLRAGFDPNDHPVSLLSLGDLGWIQITNFIVAGLLFVACALGMRRALHPGRAGTWGPWLVGAFGVSLVLGGVFVADPALGFPPGTPEGTADDMTWHGVLHAIRSGGGVQRPGCRMFRVCPTLRRSRPTHVDAPLRGNRSRRPRPERLAQPR